ncbi:MAG TPA: ABC transporter permease [Candidatus Limnocylindrales bacterium]|nr:ABC transporter permease [Candidatus Limnocylindrales bacterium]
MSGRGGYLIRKVAWALVTILVVITFNFVLFRVLPGDPAKSGLRDPRLNPAAVEALRERFGTDRPLFLDLEAGGNPFDSQYTAYLGALSRGDLGTSYAVRDAPVASLIGQALVNTLWLVLPSQVLAIVLGSALGLVAAWRRGRALDAVALTFSLFMWSLPTFFLGILLLVAGANWFGLPTAGRISIGVEHASTWDAIWDVGRHLLLPTLTLTLVLLGEYMLIMRSSVLDIFGEDYILTARAKGLSTFRIIRDHALRNAMLPMVTLIALNLGFTVSGAIQVEAVYSWPGLGALTVSAVGNRDYPVLQGAFLLIAISVVVANLLAELVYGWLDPRVSEG